MRSEAFETLFGGAAGGGKSHGQLLDAARFAVVYPGSRQLMLRRTMPELERLARSGGHAALSAERRELQGQRAPLGFHQRLDA